MDVGEDEEAEFVSCFRVQGLGFKGLGVLGLGVQGLGFRG